jgi:hypothetical protein
MANLIVLPSPPTDRNAGRGSCYVDPSPLVDVLFDQLAYLVSHARQGCPLGCPANTRFERVQRLLLMPFEEAEAHDATLERLAA